jgi:hypothetical protein
VFCVAGEIRKSGFLFLIIFPCAGGWSGFSIEANSADLVASVDKMISFNLHSAIQTAKLASLFLAKGGLLVLTGIRLFVAVYNDLMSNSLLLSYLGFKCIIHLIQMFYIRVSRWFL